MWSRSTRSEVMTTRLRWSVAVFVALAVASAAAQAPSGLSDLARAKAQAHLLSVENAQLRATVARLQAEIDTLKLTAERASLEAAMREELKLPAGRGFNWQTLAFDPPKEPK